METGGRRKTSMGFTIVEVMIVLAVSSLIALSALLLVNGRQNQTEFTTGINDLQQQLQQIINETASGYYPNSAGFNCQADASGAVKFSSGTNAQGTNQGCVFLGKAIQFGLGPGDNQLGELPLIGRQYQSDGVTPVASVGEAMPRAAWPSAAGEPSSVENLTAVDNLEYGLSVASYNAACGVASSPEAVCYEPSSNPGTYVQTGIAAFLFGDASGNLASFNSVTGNIQSGSEEMSLYGVNTEGGSQKGQARATASTSIGNVPGTTQPGSPPGGSGMGWLQSASKVLICIASGSTNQSGLFTIGAGGDGSLSVTLKVMDNLTCTA